MAEFQEVMKQAKRMCKEFGNDCAGCGLASSHCPLGPIPENMDADFANVERIIMNWAKKHPEPRYPTWEEWHTENFPNAAARVYPCVFADSKSFRCMNHGCDTCRDFPIPADIAEKLGIKPIGGDTDARDFVPR